MLIHRSPALTAIYNEIKNSDRNRVLELGPMSKGCFQLFSELSCKIQVENLASFIQDHYSNGHDVSTFNVDNCLGDYEKDEKFDVILAWDLFNYLSLDQINTLFNKLREHCKPNTLLYMLRYVEKKIPKIPRKILVKDKYLLTMAQELLVDRAVPNYSTMQLLKSMPGYFMQDTLMGQTGMLPGITEHVLRFSASDESKHFISKSETSRKSLNSSENEKFETRTHTSPSVAEVMSLLQSDDNFVVLDLGSATNRPEDIIVDRAGAYFRIDLHSLIERSHATNTELLNLSVFNHHLSRKFDVILAWDLFNYCSPQQIRQIDKVLSALSHENTFLLTLMYTGKNRPSHPSKFEVTDGNKVSITANAESSADSDVITGASLLRLLQAFNMDKTYAYRDGMERDIIEYIFAHSAATAELELQESG